MAIQLDDDVEDLEEGNVHANAEAQVVGQPDVVVLLAHQRVGNHSRKDALARYAAPFPVRAARVELIGVRADLVERLGRVAADRDVAGQPQAEAKALDRLRR